MLTALGEDFKAASSHLHAWLGTSTGDPRLQQSHAYYPNHPVRTILFIPSHSNHGQQQAGLGYKAVSMSPMNHITNNNLVIGIIKKSTCT